MRLEGVPYSNSIWIKLLYALFPIIFFSLLTHYCVSNNANNYYLNELPNLEIEGVISSKYIDSSNRNAENILFKNVAGKEEWLDRNWVNLYDSASIGDKVLKLKGERDLKLIKKDSDTIIIIFNKSGSGIY